MESTTFALWDGLAATASRECNECGGLLCPVMGPFEDPYDAALAVKIGGFVSWVPTVYRRMVSGELIHRMRIGGVTYDTYKVRFECGHEGLVKKDNMSYT